MIVHVILCLLSCRCFSNAFQLPVSLTSNSIASTSMHEIVDREEELAINRRLFIGQVSAVAVTTIASAATPAVSAATLNDQPTITHKVFFDVRISRSDGTFYVRDNVGSTTDPIDEPFYGQLVFGLYGKEAPNHVQQFLNYVDVPYDIESPLPSYSRSRFTTLDISSGLLLGGSIPGLEVSTLTGGNVLKYGGRVFPAKLWLEKNEMEQIPHNRKGLLTHRNLDLSPTFGITTLGSSQSLDSTHTVFGCVIDDTAGFLDKVLDVPVLTDTGMVSRTETGVEESLGGSIASSLFTAQRKVFRDAAQTFGDSRLDKVYDGKLLRRVDVSKVGVL